MITFLYGVPVDLSGNSFVDEHGTSHKTWEECYRVNLNIKASEIAGLDLGVYTGRHFLLGILAYFVYVKESLAESDATEQPPEVPSYGFDLIHIPPKHLFANTYNWDAKIKKFCEDAGIKRRNPIGWYAMSERMGRPVEIKSRAQDLIDGLESDIDEGDDELAALLEDDDSEVVEEPVKKEPPKVEKPKPEPVPDEPQKKRKPRPKPQIPKREWKVWPEKITEDRQTKKKEKKKDEPAKKKSRWVPLEE